MVSFETPEYTANADGLGTLRLLEAIRGKKPYDVVAHAVARDIPSPKRTTSWPSSRDIDATPAASARSNTRTARIVSASAGAAGIQGAPEDAGLRGRQRFGGPGQRVQVGQVDYERPGRQRGRRG